MDELLNVQYTDYINTVYRPHEPTCTAIGLKNLKSDVIDDTYFDIVDKQPMIKQPIGQGSATYNNIENKIIAFIDYEDFLNKLPANNTKELKKCDFIAYDLGTNSFFLLNELSQSKESKNKFSDARKQLHNALFHFSNVPVIQSFINKFDRKLCIFSNKSSTIATPENIADAFDTVKKYLPEPIEHDFQPITKLNFKFIETAIIDV